MNEPQDPALPLFSTQLRDAYLFEASIKRREKQPEDASAPTLNATLDPPRPGSDANSFSQMLRVAIGVPFNEGAALLELSCTYDGVFASSTTPLTQAEIDAMASRTTMVLLWPYLRAGVAELGRMTGIPVPPLPTLDVLSFSTEASAEGDSVTTAPAKARSSRGKKGAQPAQ